MHPLKYQSNIFVPHQHNQMIFVFLCTSCDNNVSPSGVHSIVFTSNLNDNWDIYTILSDGSNLQRITSDIAIDANPVWSSKGNQIAYQSDQIGNLEIYVMNPDE